MEIGRADSSLAVTMGVNHLVCEVINLYGSEEHKQRYLPILTNGDGIGSFCLSEPQAGSALKIKNSSYSGRRRVRYQW